MVVTCKYCKKYECKKQHPAHILVEKCMWNKKAVCFRYKSRCKKMGFEFLTQEKIEKG